MEARVFGAHYRSKVIALKQQTHFCRIRFVPTPPSLSIEVMASRVPLIAMEDFNQKKRAKKVLMLLASSGGFSGALFCSQEKGSDRLNHIQTACAIYFQQNERRSDDKNEMKLNPRSWWFLSPASSILSFRIKHTHAISRRDRILASWGLKFAFCCLFDLSRRRRRRSSKKVHFSIPNSINNSSSSRSQSLLSSSSELN